MKPGTPWRPFASPLPDPGGERQCFSSTCRGTKRDHDVCYTQAAFSPLVMITEECSVCHRLTPLMKYHTTTKTYSTVN